MKDLISALKYCDDEVAFEKIFSVTKEKVFHFFLKKTGSEEDAKDLLQNVYFRLWKYRKTMNEDILLDQHLFQYAKMVYIDYLKSRKHQYLDINDQNHESQASLIQQPLSVFSLLDKKDILHLLEAEAALNRQIFILNKFEGYSYRQLADKFSLSVKSIDNYINKTLKRLRKKI